MIAGISSEELFGFIVCDAAVPDHLKKKFAQFQPIFKNEMVSIDDVGEVMRELCIRYGYLKTPARTLIASFFGNGILLTSDQVIWYLNHGK